MKLNILKRCNSSDFSVWYYK